jgi:hypothetical protein
MGCVHSVPKEPSWEAEVCQAPKCAAKNGAAASTAPPNAKPGQVPANQEEKLLVSARQAPCEQSWAARHVHCCDTLCPVQADSTGKDGKGQDGKADARKSSTVMVVYKDADEGSVDMAEHNRMEALCSYNILDTVRVPPMLAACITLNLAPSQPCCMQGHAVDILPDHTVSLSPDLPARAAFGRVCNGLH